MKVFLLAALLSAATAQPIPLGQSGGSSSEQIPIPFPFPFDPNQVLTPNQLIALITSILNQLQGFLGK